MIRNLIYLLRPQQWIKNLFIFIPLFFDKHLFDIPYIQTCLLSFLSFCFAASSIYCLNDIIDVESDKLHPTKSKRPIASGAVSLKNGYVLMLSSIFISLSIAYLIPNRHWLVIGIISLYYFINILYCLILKNKVIIDVFIISLGFVIRIFIGGIATNIWLSHWIILMTFLLALFLAFAKRRDDVNIYNETGIKTRKNIHLYNIDFLNQVIAITASITIVCYIMYTVSEEVIQRIQSSNLYLTSIFVIAGMIHYIYITTVNLESGSPTKILLKDHFIQGCIICWLISFYIILYI